MCLLFPVLCWYVHHLLTGNQWSGSVSCVPQLGESALLQIQLILVNHDIKYNIHFTVDYW